MEDELGMIRLEIAEYCSECEDFKASVETPAKYFAEDEVIVLSDTVISCANKKRCEAIRRYLERKLIKND